MTPKPAKTRKNVSLTSEDLDDLVALRTVDSPHAQAFADLTGLRVGADTSEAAVLHGLIEIGRCAVKERAQDLAYQLAAKVDAEDPERQMWRMGMRRHRRRRQDGSSRP